MHTMGLYSGKTIARGSHVSLHFLLNFSFSANLLSTYYVPGAMMDHRNRGLV